MYHYLSKILVWGIYPLTLGMFLLLISFLFERKRDRKLFKLTFFFGFLILYLFSIIPLTQILVRPLQITDSPELETDVIIILGGDPARSLTGIRLFKKGVAPIIISAGGSGELLQEKQKESDRMTDFLVEFGVPKDRVISESQSKNTRENAIFSKQIMDSLNVKNIALVTSSLHMRRSKAVFKKLGYNTATFNSKLFRIPKKQTRFDPFTLMPKVENLSISTQAIYEYFALLLYKILGWI
tara:strand:- start:6650 stop:7369 length:720 start_codon:yes stop_codon:yes gene_type:complete